MKEISRGAEAIIYLKDAQIVKVRDSKKYRHPNLDLKIRDFRTRREEKVLRKLHEGGVNVPKIIDFDRENTTITMEFISGRSLFENLSAKTLELAFKEIIKMHKLGIVHGDLTTMNMLEFQDKVFLIDFGLGEFTSKVEDLAVDLHLFFACIKNEHSEFYKLRDELEKIYADEFSSEVVKRIYEIEERGRNKKN